MKAVLLQHQQTLPAGGDKGYEVIGTGEPNRPAGASAAAGTTTRSNPTPQAIGGAKGRAGELAREFPPAATKKRSVL